VIRRFPHFFCAAGLALCACSNDDDTDADGDFATTSTLAVKSYVSGELSKLTSAAEALQKAAPAADDDGWNADDDKAAVQSMKDAWYKTREAYEHVEGSIAVVFMTLDISTDERYDGFVETDPDDDLFDDEGVTGVHGVERILWSDTTPERVVKFEAALENYKAASFPTTKEEADEFKNKLAARLVTDTKKMRDDFAANALAPYEAFRGMIGSMQEQSEKTTKAASGEDESRYAQNTLADMRANLAGARAVFEAFKPWIETVEDKTRSKAIENGFEEIEAAYDENDGRSLPPVPKGFNPDKPTDADLATPYGKLWKLLTDDTDIENKDSVVYHMAAAADAMGLQELPED
jgi:iron uptake system component EfeO